MASTETKLRKNTVQSLSLTYAEMSRRGVNGKGKGRCIFLRWRVTSMAPYVPPDPAAERESSVFGLSYIHEEAV
jgi:hypothetical protein